MLTSDLVLGKKMSSHLIKAVYSRPLIPIVYQHNTSLRLLEENPESLKITHLRIVIYKLFLYSIKILHGLLHC